MSGRRIFIYGTLLAPDVFARFGGRAPLRRAMPARLPGYRRVQLRGTPYPTLLRAPGDVPGLLLPRLAGDVFARLSRYEGASYRLLPVRVMTARGPRCARAWMAPPWRAGEFHVVIRGIKNKTGARDCERRHPQGWDRGDHASLHGEAEEGHDGK